VVVEVTATVPVGSVQLKVSVFDERFNAGGVEVLATLTVAVDVQPLAVPVTDKV